MTVHTQRVNLRTNKSRNIFISSDVLLDVDAAEIRIKSLFGTKKYALKMSETTITPNKLRADFRLKSDDTDIYISAHTKRYHIATIIPWFLLFYPACFLVISVTGKFWVGASIFVAGALLGLGFDYYQFFQLQKKLVR